jgi:hypothetical protein
MTNNANTVAILSGGSSYFFNDGTAAPTDYTGANSPWTNAVGSCYVLANNTTAGPIWVPQAPVAQMIYSGGPPFAIGRKPVLRAFDTVTEQIGIQLNATTKDNAIFLLRQLRQVLNTATYSLPAVLSVKGGTNTGYAEIFSADIQESALYLNETTGKWRAAIAWTRSPLFGVSSLATLVNGATMTNRGTSTNPNIQALGALTGDLVNEGQPLNIKLVKPSGTSAPSHFYFATVVSRVYTAIATGAFTTASTALPGTTIGTITPSITSALTNDAIKARFVGRVKTLTNPSHAIVSVRVYTSGAGFIWQSKWIPLLTDTTGQYVDFGAMDLSFFQIPIATAITLSADILLRSADGTSVTLTLDYMEFLLYYDFCYADFTTSMSSGEALFLDQAQNRSGGGWLPMQRARAYYGTSVSVFDPTIPGIIVGDPPLARPNTSLYVAWRGTLDGAHVATETSTVTVTHAPLYYTVRGGA